VSELFMVKRRPGFPDGAPWVLEGGARRHGYDDDRRIRALQAGLTRHSAVRAFNADADDEVLAQTLSSLHEPHYLRALCEVDGEQPQLLPELAPPGLPADIPVSAGIVAAAREGVRTAIGAARCILDGARFAYALCRPPGHHAGPEWLGGYCYLNNAAAAALTLREGAVNPVGVLDLDLHYPNGTSAIAQRMGELPLHSLHAWPVTNAPSDLVLPRTCHERLVEFRTAPTTDAYLDAVRESLRELTPRVGAIVLSLGYDTVKGDPHGSWAFPPQFFARIGGELAATGLPICVVQEGGYALRLLPLCAYAFASGLLSGGMTKGTRRALGSAA
jgi:acetoin utilization deacetylase AcuC-like enzyme